jgi:hypothetical protein
MCRTINGRISFGGEILSGSDDDPGLDFSVKREQGNSDTTIDVTFKTPFKAPPSLTVTPVYSKSVVSFIRQGTSPGNLLLISNENTGFSLFESWESAATRPEYFNFSAIG